MRYIIDLNFMREYVNISEYIHNVFNPLLDDCELNLDAIYDGLSSHIQGGEIFVKNMHILADFGKKGESLKEMLEMLADEFLQWQISFEPNVQGVLKNVRAHVANGEINHLFLDIDKRVMTLKFDKINECLALQEVDENFITNLTQNIQNLNAASELLGLKILGKNDICGLFGTSGIEINFANTQKVMFISALENSSNVTNLDDCLKIEISKRA